MIKINGTTPDASTLVTIFQGLCEDRGECVFRGNERGDGNEISLFVDLFGEDRQNLADAQVLVRDIEAIDEELFQLTSIVASSCAGKCW